MRRRRKCTGCVGSQQVIELGSFRSAMLRGTIQVNADQPQGPRGRTGGDVLGAVAAVGLVVAGIALVSRATS
jgi:hypothetical protein